MVSTEKAELNGTAKDRLVQNIAETNRYLYFKFPKYTLGSLVLILFLILVFIAQYEDYEFSVFLKLATIFPLIGIATIFISYFHERGTAKKLKSYYNQILKEGSYEVLRVENRHCSKYIDGSHEYFLFEFDRDNALLLMINDFSVSPSIFPNDNFIIPPYELLDVVGNEIICQGNVIKSSQYENIKELLPAFNMLEAGQVMIKRKV